MMADTDVFRADEPTNVIVDCDVLEAAKENIQPLAAGRRVTSISAVLRTPHAQREANLAVTRHRLRLNVEIALQDEDDSPLDNPLEAYCRLVYWTIDNYPQGPCAESGLLELLEEATRVLKDDRGGKWRGEVKYMKLWVLYSTFVNKPAVIFKFLLANEIGTSLALLYEEYAVALERNGRRAEADAVYLLGIARKADPLDRLKSRHREFQKRMMSSAPLPPAQPPEAGASSSKRQALATTSTSSTTTFTRPRPSPSDARPSTSTSKSNSRIPVYVDGAGTDEPEPSPWPELGTRKSRIKENIPEVKKMAGTIIRQPGRELRIASGPVVSKIVPYRDPLPGDEGMPPPPDPIPRTIGKAPRTTESRRGDTVAPTPSFTPFRDEPEASSVSSPSPAGLSTVVPDSVMKVKMVGKRGLTVTSEAEALRNNPLKNHGLTGDEIDDDP